MVEDQRTDLVFLRGHFRKGSATAARNNGDLLLCLCTALWWRENLVALTSLCVLAKEKADTIPTATVKSTAVTQPDLKQLAAFISQGETEKAVRIQKNNFFDSEYETNHWLQQVVHEGTADGTKQSAGLLQNRIFVDWNLWDELAYLMRSYKCHYVGTELLEALKTGQTKLVLSKFNDHFYLLALQCRDSGYSFIWYTNNLTLQKLKQQVPQMRQLTRSVANYIHLLNGYAESDHVTVTTLKRMMLCWNGLEFGSSAFCQFVFENLESDSRLRVIVGEGMSDWKSVKLVVQELDHSQQELSEVVSRIIQQEMERQRKSAQSFLSAECKMGFTSFDALCAANSINNIFHLSSPNFADFNSKRQHFIKEAEQEISALVQRAVQLGVRRLQTHKAPAKQSQKLSSNRQRESELELEISRLRDDLLNSATVTIESGVQLHLDRADETTVSSCSQIIKWNAHDFALASYQFILDIKTRRRQSSEDSTQQKGASCMCRLFDVRPGEAVPPNETIQCVGCRSVYHVHCIYTQWPLRLSPKDLPPFILCGICAGNYQFNVVCSPRSYKDEMLKSVDTNLSKALYHFARTVNSKVKSPLKLCSLFPANPKIQPLLVLQCLAVLRQELIKTYFQFERDELSRFCGLILSLMAEEFCLDFSRYTAQYMHLLESNPAVEESITGFVQYVINELNLISERKHKFAVCSTGNLDDVHIMLAQDKWDVLCVENPGNDIFPSQIGVMKRGCFVIGSKVYTPIVSGFVEVDNPIVSVKSARQVDFQRAAVCFYVHEEAVIHPRPCDDFPSQCFSLESSAAPDSDVFSLPTSKSVTAEVVSEDLGSEVQDDISSLSGDSDDCLTIGDGSNPKRGRFGTPTVVLQTLNDGCGLQNDGSDCFLNATVQLLSVNELFVTKLCILVNGHSEDMILLQMSPTLRKHYRFIQALSECLELIQENESVGSVMNLTFLRSHTTVFNDDEQHDAQELLTYIYDVVDRMEFLLTGSHEI